MQNLICGWKQTPTWQRANVSATSEVFWEHGPLYFTHGGSVANIPWLGLGIWESRAPLLALSRGFLASFGQVNPGHCALTLPTAEQITGMTFARHLEN